MPSALALVHGIFSSGRTWDSLKVGLWLKNSGEEMTLSIGCSPTLGQMCDRRETIRFRVLH